MQSRNKKKKQEKKKMDVISITSVEPVYKRSIAGFEINPEKIDKMYTWPDMNEIKV